MTHMLAKDRADPKSRKGDTIRDLLDQTTGTTQRRRGDPSWVSVRVFNWFIVLSEGREEWILVLGEERERWIQHI
jgi:hypothetical protein